jgi:phenylalanyl-tRNA synthetase beta chain
VTKSFCERRGAELFGGVPEELVLLNPISADLDVMRPSVLPHLIAAAGRNADRGLGASRLFEVGPAYRSAEPDGQEAVAAGVRNGQRHPRHWAQPARPVDAFDAKADALAALAAIGAPVDRLQVVRAAPGWYHPGRSAALKLGPKVTLAYFGELHPRVLRALDVDGPVVGFEVYLDALPAPKSKSTTRPRLAASSFQPVRRDFAFVVDADTEAETLLRAARGADPLIAEVSLFDVYTGEHVGEGQKSLAIEAMLQPVERTLTDEEIEAVAAKLVEAVTKATGGSLRG